MIRKKPTSIIDKEQFIKWFYAALIGYLDIHATNVNRQTIHKLDDIKKRGFNARYYDLEKTWSVFSCKLEKFIQSIDLPHIPQKDQLESSLTFLKEKKSLLHKRIRIFNEDLDETQKKYKLAQKIIHDSLTRPSKSQVIAFTRNMSKLFSKDTPILESHEIKQIDGEKIESIMLNDPLVEAYEELITFLSELPDQVLVNDTKDEILTTHQHAQDVEEETELVHALEQIDLAQDIEQDSEDENELMNIYSYHPRVARWFENVEPIFIRDPKYKAIQSEAVKNKISLFHNFSRVADYFVLKFGIKNEELKEYPQSIQFALPCIIKTNTTEYRGKVIYCVDKQTNTIWHRCFKEHGYETFRTDYITDSIWIKDIDFPQIKVKATKETGKNKTSSASNSSSSMRKIKNDTENTSHIKSRTTSFVTILDRNNQAEISLEID